MKKRLALLFAAGLVISSGVAWYQIAPGYMDAEYYLLGGQSLVQGNGFWEPVLWNYLDDPAGLPHPSHGYWLPAVSVLSALGLLFDPGAGFDAAKWVFVLVAALVPPLTALLAYRIYNHLNTDRRLWAAGLAGLLALFPGYYVGFLTTTDAFGPYMLLGALYFLVLLSEAGPTKKAVLLGALAGLMQLTRTDGFAWLLAAGWILFRRDRRTPIYLLLAFALVLSPWIARNLSAFGQPFAPGGLRVLWSTGYDDLFAYPADSLTPGRWLASGPVDILAARLRAAGQNLVSLVAVGGLVFLAPLFLAGAARLRDRAVVQTGALGWLLVFLVMSLAFPFAGARGGYFHAAAALQPLLWALAPEGLAAFTDWGGRTRGWRPAQAARVFGAGACVIAAIVTGYLGYERIVAPALRADRQEFSVDFGVEHFLQARGFGEDEVAMVNNPPGYTLRTDRPAIVIPTGGLPAILAAADRYGAEFLILGPNQGLPEIYDDPDGQPGLLYLGDTFGALLIFRFVETP